MNNIRYQISQYARFNKQLKNPIQVQKIGQININLLKQININMQIEQEKQQHHFLLFVNSKSGGRKGVQYLKLTENRIKFKSNHGYIVYVYFYDLFNEIRRQIGFRNVLQLSKTVKNINLIICGGDGTVLWVVQSAVKIGIDLDKVCFGIIPIGTGNDFSRTLGWGGSPISCSQQNIKQLRKIVQKWVGARKQSFDLWDTQISTYEGGCIINSSSNVQSQNKNVIKKTFSNYLGIGIDARVSYHFQKNRTSNKFLNLSIYGCLGFCFCLKKTQKMNNAIEQFLESQDQNFSATEKTQGSQKQMSDREKNKVQLLQYDESKLYSQVKIKKGYTGIVCLNCTSYMSGVKNIFNTSKIAAKNKKNSDFTEQRFNDGVIQFVGFKNELELGLERFIHSAGRISQGSGPFNIKFSLNKQQQTFIQIDGQAMKVKRLKQIKIQRSKIIPSGQIRVLVNASDD